MINRYATPNTALSLVTMAADRARLWNEISAKNKPEQYNPLLDMQKAHDPEKAAALRKEREAIKDIIQQLESSKIDISERRKKAAQEKIRRLEAEIMALRMMVNGDPKALARQIARLARELASAVSVYAGAGGGGGMNVSAVSSSATVIASPAPAPALTSILTSAATANTATTTVNAPKAQATQSTTASHPKDAAADAPSAKSAAQDVSAPESRKAVLLKMIDEQVEKATKLAADNAEDEKFIRTVRRLAEELKNLLKQAKQQMQAEGGASSDQDVMAAEASLRETAGLLSNISGAAMSVSVSVNIST